MADETLYLRSSSINIFNGLVSLTFSCDGTHYMSWQEFLDKDMSFWVAARRKQQRSGVHRDGTAADELPACVQVPLDIGPRCSTAARYQGILVRHFC